MELRHLRYFLAVAEECHFRNAAEALLVSQPTLSQQIKDLEAELGVSLFERTGRRARLTQAGKLFQEYAHRAIGVIEEGQTALHELDGLTRGRLSIGVVQTVNAYLTPLAVAEFAKRHPEVLLRIEELSAHEIETGVLAGELDLGVSFEPMELKELIVTRLFEEELVLVVGANDPLMSDGSIRVAELHDKPLALMGKAFCTRRLVDECFAKARVAPKITVEMNSVSGLLALASSGGPATILPELGAKGRKTGIIRLERPTPSRKVCLLQAKSAAPLRSRTRFVEILSREIQRGKRE